MNQPTSEDFFDSNAMHRYAALLKRLFDTDGSKQPDGVTTIECQVILRSGYKIAGALSLSPEGVLRMLMPADYKLPTGQTVPIVAEHFFTVVDIETLIMIRRVEAPTADRKIIVAGQ